LVNDKETNNNKILLLHKHINDTLYKSFPTLTFFFIVNEKNKKGNLHFHAIVSIRNFIDYNKTLKINMIAILYKSISIYLFHDNNSTLDLKIESLRYFKDIKNWVIYMHKDMIL